MAKTTSQETKLPLNLRTDDFVGWLYQSDFACAALMTNDAWLARNPLPRDALLLALDPDSDGEGPALLLRVRTFGELPLTDELLVTKLQQLQERSPRTEAEALDPITLSQLQFSRIDCDILGTFFRRAGQLAFGSDRATCSAATALAVFRLTNDSLAEVVNYFPRRDRGALSPSNGEDLRPIRLGQIRYASTWTAEQPEAPLEINPADYLAKRTMCVGQTRSGKSCHNKLVIQRLKPTLDNAGLPLAVVCIDPNGEYGSDNAQDGKSLASAFPDRVVQYSLVPRPGFLPLQNNFYRQPREALSIFRRVLKENKADGQPDIATFLSACFECPDRRDFSPWNRYQVKLASFQVLLHRAGFPAPGDFKIRFPVSLQVRQLVEATAGSSFADPAQGLELEEAEAWFLAARTANRTAPLPSANGKAWADNDTVAIWNLLAGLNSNDAYISGYKLLTQARRYHSPRRSEEVYEEIYGHICAGKIIILDLSLGDPVVRSRLVEQLASDIFHRSLERFTNGQVPPPLLLLVEECHNLLGRDMRLTDPWPRLAKEGGKLQIGLLLSTQEPSSIHRDILANTENWVVFHLNSEPERRVVQAYYDFASFEDVNAPEPGWARMKMASQAFVLPVQIDPFSASTEPEKDSASLSNSRRNGQLLVKA